MKRSSTQEMAALDRGRRRPPRALKAPLILTAFEDLSQQEAGDILGVSAKTIETRTRRARQILARTLDPGSRPRR
jgi:RNA polymerase sigma-70 factor (ECF subfamily)